MKDFNTLTYGLESWLPCQSQSYPFVWNKYDKQFEQVCKSIQCISMAVLLGFVMLKVSLIRLQSILQESLQYSTLSFYLPQVYSITMKAKYANFQVITVQYFHQILDDKIASWTIVEQDCIPLTGPVLKQFKLLVLLRQGHQIKTGGPKKIQKYDQRMEN